VYQLHSLFASFVFELLRFLDHEKQSQQRYISFPVSTMSPKSTIFLAGAFATQVLAHGILNEFTADGVGYEGFATESIYKIQNGNPVPDIAAWSTEAVDRDYIEPNSMGTQDINCHKNAAPGVLSAKVAAGGTVEFFWADWPHNQGPVLTYIAPCGGDCATADKSALKWIKIDEAGWDGEWAGQKLMDNNFTWTTTVPATIAAGNYVFRNEIINLHSGVEPNGAQLYPQCVNIEITGDGTDTPEGTLGVDLYKADDAGILFDGASTKITEYPIPGPPLYVPGDSSVPASGDSASNSTQTPSAAATSVASTIVSQTATVNGTYPVATGTLLIPVIPTTFVTRTAASATGTGRARPSGCRAYNPSKLPVLFHFTQSAWTSRY
jgi:hypothetical protein